MSIIRESTIEQTVGRAEFGPLAALVASTVIGAGASLIGSSKAAGAAKDASALQAEADQKAIDAQLEMYYQSRADTAPWMSAGTSSLNTLMGTNYQTPGIINPDAPGYAAPTQPAATQNALAQGTPPPATSPGEQASEYDYFRGVPVEPLDSSTPRRYANRGSTADGAQWMQIGPNLAEYNKDGVTWNWELPPGAEDMYQGPETQPAEQAPAATTGTPVTPTQPVTTGPGLIEGPDTPYTGQTPNELLNAGFNSAAQNPSNWLAQNQFQYAGDDPTARIQEGFQYSGPSTDFNPVSYNWSPDKFTFNQEDPSYQWRYNEGQKATERRQNAMGMTKSGRTLKELQRYGQGMASQEYQNEFARFLNQQQLAAQAAAERARIALGSEQSRTSAALQAQDMEQRQWLAETGLTMDDWNRQYGQHLDQFNMNQSAYNQDWARNMDRYNMRRADYGDWYGKYQDKVNRYMNIAGAGQQTASQNAQNALSVGSNLANINMNTGNAMAQGAMNAGNAQAAGYVGVGNAINQGIGNYLTYNLLKGAGGLG